MPPPMSRGLSPRNQRPRELRRRVILPARMRSSAGWSDACILNVSSRGLMIHSNQSVAEGASIELRHCEHVIVAQVVWRSGSRAGLLSEDRVPVEQILLLSQSPALQLTAGGRVEIERRKRPRSHENSRQLGRMVEFASVAIIGLALSIGVVSLVAEALGRPMDRIRVALDAGSSPASP
ncbi:MAG TPA: PilZ domain-containing protein [Sphingomicrobium sp.]